MTPQPILRASIQPRIDGIRKNIVQLKTLSDIPFEEFQKGASADLAHHFLRLTLEGVFNITSHILSRIPGGRETEYKRMARKLGEVGIIDRDFANSTLVKMGGYRNRLTHFYAQVKADELYDICKNHLKDIEFFLKAIREVMEHPEKYNLTIAP